MEGLPGQQRGRHCRLCPSLGRHSRATWQDIRVLGSGAPGTGPSPAETAPAEAQSCLGRVLASFTVHADAQVLDAVLLVHGLAGPRVSLRPQSARLQNSSRQAHRIHVCEDSKAWGTCAGVKGTCLAGPGLGVLRGERQPVWVLLWPSADRAHGAASQMLLLEAGTVSGSGPAARGSGPFQGQGGGS